MSIDTEKIAQVSTAMIIVEQANKIKTLEAKNGELEKKLEYACDSLCTERNQFELKYCDEKRKTDDLRILLDANKEMADKMEFHAKKFGIKLKLAIKLLNEAGPIMERHYLRKAWFEGVNELNKVEEA